MKTTRKAIALLLAIVMVLALSATAFAANSETETGSIEVMNPMSGKTYTAYKIFDVTYDDAKNNYAYTIASTSDWLSAVKNYIDAAADEDGVYEGNGLTLTPYADGYTVTYDADTFSAPDFAAAMKAAGVTTGGVTLQQPEGAATAKAEGLDLGYWLVLPTSGALASLTTTDKDVQVYDKNEKPEVEKDITGDDNDVNAVSIGDNIPYTVTTKIPDMTGYTQYFFVVKDTMSEGLTFNNDVIVTVGGDTLTADEPAVEADAEKGIEAKDAVEHDYYVETSTDADGNTLIKIVFHDMVTKRAADVGETVVINYSATLNENAAIDDPNTNTAKVVYSSDPSVTPQYKDGETPPDNPPDDPEDPIYKPATDTYKPYEVSAESKTETFTTELDVFKTANDSTTPLTGAKFKLEGTAENIVLVTGENFVPYEAPAEGEAPAVYYKLADGNFTTDAPVTADTMVEAPAGYDTANGGYIVCADTDEGAAAYGSTYYRPITNEDDLTDKTVYLLQKANTALYDSVDDQYMKVTTQKYETKGATPVTAEAFVDSTGHLVFSGIGPGEYTLTEIVVPDGFNPIDPITLHVAFDETEKELYIVELMEKKEVPNEATEDNPDDVIEVNDPETYTMDLNVINKSGNELPSTGGIGTTLFYVFGAILLCGAAVLLITKKRMSAES